MYKRRIKIFMGLIAAVFLVILARLWQLQVITGEESRRQIEESLRIDQPLPPAVRGKIMDRGGEFLAIDKPCHELCLDYRFLTGDRSWVRAEQRKIAERENVSLALAEKIYAERAEDTWRLAAEFSNLSMEALNGRARWIIRRVEAIREIVGTEVREQREFHPVVTGLDAEAAAKLKSHLDEMVGATVKGGFVRYYPHGSLACHVIGVTGQVNAEEQARLNLSRDRADWLTRARNNYFDGDVIGKTGIEKLCESVLRSRRGHCIRKRSRNGFQVLEELPAEPGRDVKLTIDHRLQERLTTLFLEKTNRQGGGPSNGAIVMLSVPEGEVLAMVSLPVYDLNRYHSDYKSIIQDRANLPLLHRAVGRLYPLGSTAKPMAALAGLEEKAITINSQFYCDGRLTVGPRTTLHCWTHWRQMPGHGSLNVSEGLKHSCNIFFYQVGAKLGLERLSQFLVRMGFADTPGLGLPQERCGTVPTEQWLAENRPTYHAVPIDAMQVAIGQGFFGATPLHVANAMATIARGGRVQTPVLVVEGYAGTETRHEDLGIEAVNLKVVVEGMRRVVNESGGTAYKIFHGPGIEPLDVDIHGKTGTATAPPADLDGNGRIDDHERKRNEMAWFAGFALLRGQADEAAPAGRGIAFAVVVEYVEGGGARNAGPIAREAIRIWREMYRQK